MKLGTSKSAGDRRGHALTLSVVYGLLDMSLKL